MNRTPSVDTGWTFTQSFPAPLTLGQDNVEVVGAPTAPAGEGTAQAPGGAPAGGAGPGGGGGGGLGLFPLLLAMVAFMVIMMVMSGRREKKQRQQHASMLAALKKHDRVRTSGGVIGTVAEIREEEVVLKVDESTNSRCRFAKAAIQQVLTSAKGAGTENGQDEAILEEEPAEAGASR